MVFPHDVSTGYYAGVCAEISDGSSVSPALDDHLETLQRMSSQQLALAELAQAALTGVDVEILLGQTCALVESVLSTDRSSIHVPGDGEWHRRAAIGDDFGIESCATHAPEHRRLLDEAFRVAEPILVQSAHLHREHGISGGCAVAIPEVGGRVYGVMTIWNRQRRNYAPDEMAFLHSVARMTGSMLESARAVDRIRESELRFRALIENSTDGIVLIDAAARIRYVSPSTSRLLGFSDTELLGRRIDEFVHPVEVDTVRDNHARILASPSEPIHDEVRVRTGSEAWIHLGATATNLLHEPNVRAIVINYRDITERRQAEQELERLAYRDSLTNLPNRFLFNDRLRHALSLAERQETGVALLLLDLDHFKLVNDTLGHAAGDDLLKAFSSRLSALVRAQDTVARLGGDEFAILLSGSHAASGATRLAHAILSSLRKPFSIGAHQLYTHTSIGVSSFPEDGADAETLLKNADSALYRAKEMGRNNVQTFTTSMKERYRVRLELEQKLRGAVEREELTLHYQPIVNLATGEAVCVEALMRWNLKDGTSISPAAFIPIAEDSGLILQMGEWAFNTALAQLRYWREQGFEQLRVAVNLSPHQLQQPDVVARLLGAVRNAGVEPADIELEVTESAAVQSLQWTMKVLDELKAHGFAIAIDDFGTGQSSLAYLKRFPLDTLKIDREFLQDVKIPSNEAILSSIILLGHSLGLSVVAEGIETVEELRLLERHGCDGIQGFLLARPAPAGDIQHLIRELPERLRRLRG